MCDIMKVYKIFQDDDRACLMCVSPMRGRNVLCRRTGVVNTQLKIDCCSFIKFLFFLFHDVGEGGF